MKTTFNPIDTIFSVASIIDIEGLTEAKKLMTEKYGNIYTHLPPHISYAIVPCPEKNFEQGKVKLVEYVKKQKAFNVHISDLMYEEKDKFFYVSITGPIITKLHEETTLLLNRYRDNCIRTKDLKRIKEGKFDDISLKYLKEFGYGRVFNNFTSHITVGNFTVENVDIKALEKQLRKILRDVLNKDITINNIELVYYSDPTPKQEDMKIIWREMYSLDN